MPCPSCGGPAVTVTRKIGDTHVVLCDLDHVFVERTPSRHGRDIVGDAVVLVLGFCLFAALWIVTP